MNRRKIIRVVLIAGGIVGMGVSLFAFQLGLDNDPGWGAGRSRIMGAGVALVLFGAAYWMMPAMAGWQVGMAARVNNLAAIQGAQRLFQRIRSWFGEFSRRTLNSAPIQKAQGTGWFSWLSRNRMNVRLVLLGVCIAWLYVWVITIGRMEKWPSGRDYYWLLTQAFRQGQVHLLVEPNPELLNLENPYDHHQRKGIEYLWDTTLYNGRYYLYWGPVPAVLGLIVSSTTSGPVTDTALVFSFVVGTALFSVLLLLELHGQFKLVPWVFWGGVLASVVNIPLIWLLTRPTFYEVSISGGQFFVCAGFYLLLRAFRQSVPNKGCLALAALSFGLAGATRINLLPSVVFLAGVMGWRILAINKKSLGPSLPALVSVFLPLSLVACSLLWYNHARFGSIFEFGHRFQLTGPGLPADYEDISSAAYILPNLYTYVFRPPSLSGEFPFLTLPWIKENMWPSFIRLPDHYYYTEPVAGMLFIVPLLGLTALLLIRDLWHRLNGDGSPPRPVGQHAQQFAWFGFSLLAYCVIQMSILLIFINSAVRYLFDVLPALILLSTMYTDRRVQSITAKSHPAGALAFLWILASLLTVISGFFIGFTGERNNFLNQNPGLYHRLLEWFGG